MRITSYNIYDGGVGRADPLAEILLAQRADVATLLEADDEVVLEHLARRLEMDFIAAPGRGHDAAVLSRWPIVQTVNHAALLSNGPRSFVEAVIAVPGGAEISIFVIHFSAGAYMSDERCRLGELSAVLAVTRPLRDAGRPHLLAGDFNANSPSQAIDIRRCEQPTRDAFAANGERLPRDLIEAVLAAGYTDTLAAADDNAARTATTFTTHEPGQRLDYIFTFALPAAAVMKAWIEKDRLATYASDHYPIGVEIDVEINTGPHV